MRQRDRDRLVALKEARRNSGLRYYALCLADPDSTVVRIIKHLRALWHNSVMPKDISPKSSMPAGTLPMLILHVLQSGALHGYAIAQRIHILSSEVLTVEEGLLYPTLQKMLLKGWATAKWGTSESNRKVRFYQLTRAGREQLKTELLGFDRATQAIFDVLRTDGRNPA